jgi:uncharacterized repeat protein (TIGR01451 family)
MRKTWTVVGFVMVVVVVFPAGVLAEEPPAGLSAPEWQQITNAIEVEMERNAPDGFPKDESRSFSLDQKLGPQPSYHWSNFGYSVAVDGDLAAVGAPTHNDVFVLSREVEGWEFAARIMGPNFVDNYGWECESVEFGTSVALEGSKIVVGDPGSECVGPPPLYEQRRPGNAWVFDETDPGSWTPTTEMGLRYLIQGDLLPPDWESDHLRFGDAVAISANTIAVGAPHASHSGEFQAGSVLVWTGSGGTWVHQQSLVAAYPGSFDHLGASLALSGDTVVVGAPDDEVSFYTDAGRAIVFDRSGGVWSQTQELTAVDHASGDHFGTSVSLLPGSVLVGAPDDDHAAGADAGSVYEFTNSGGAWSQDQKLVALDGEAGDRFGAAVALGWGMAVIGAPGDNHGMSGIDAGSAYVFTPLVGTWFQAQKLVAPAGEISDGFGSAVGVWGMTAMLGSPYDDFLCDTDAGSVHAFENEAGVWTHRSMLVGPYEIWGDGFSRAVDLDGEFMVVGARGTAYFFSRKPGGWELEWKEAGSHAGKFGDAVAISGDTVVIGAEGRFNLPGRVWVYRRGVGGLGPPWELEASIEASDNPDDRQDGFGFALDIEGDVLVVGALYRAIGDDDACGAIYSYSRSGTVWYEDQIVESNAPSADDQLGISVDLNGDVFVAGAIGADMSSTLDAGAVYIFRRTAGTWNEEQKIAASLPLTGAALGRSVALDGSTVVAGAPGEEVTGLPDAGAAYVFVESGGVWTGEQRLTASTPAAGDLFGQTVAVDGDTAVIGTPGRDFRPHAQVGAVNVFHRSGSTWDEIDSLFSSSPQTDANFGWALALTQDELIATAPGEVYANPFHGAVYVFGEAVEETDLAIVMDDWVMEVVPGTAVSYLMVVTNAGPSEAMGATVTDVFPPELLGCSWTCEDFSGALCTAGPVAGDIDDAVDLPVGGRLEYTADCMVDPAATGDLVNTATVTTPPGVADTNPLNNIATDLDTLTPVADLSISKDNGVTQIIEGQTTVYTITVANAGPSDAPASTVTDVFPVELSGCSWTCAPGGGAACSPSGAGDLADFADLPAASGVNYLATCTVAATGGQCSNTAEVTAPVGVMDPDPLNNDATDTDEIVGLADVIFADGFESGDTSAWIGSTVE